MRPGQAGLPWSLQVRSPHPVDGIIVLIMSHSPTALAANVSLLLLTAMVKIGFTAWTFGMMVPAGIFLPTIAIGACLGRAVGLLTYAYIQSI